MNSANNNPEIKNVLNHSFARVDSGFNYLLTSVNNNYRIYSGRKDAYGQQVERALGPNRSSTPDDVTAQEKQATITSVEETQRLKVSNETPAYESRPAAGAEDVPEAQAPITSLDDERQIRLRDAQRAIELLNLPVSQPEGEGYAKKVA